VRIPLVSKLTSSPLIDDRSDFLEERMDAYEEWIHTAKVRHLHISKYCDN
jgi:hypothetical protein